MSKLKLVLDEIIIKGYTIDKDGIISNPQSKKLKGCVYDKYLKISVRTSENSSFPVRVHKFQAYVKFGDKIFEKGIVVRHLDGDSLNNKWDNIAIGTQSQNMMDRPEIDRKNHSDGKGKITEEIKDKIKLYFENGDSIRLISKKVDVKRTTLSDYLKKNNCAR